MSLRTCYTDLCLVPQVTVSGITVMFSGSMGNVTGLALMNGVTYSVSVVARNSIGDSGMFIVMLFVPCECPGPANVVLYNLEEEAHFYVVHIASFVHS